MPEQVLMSRQRAQNVIGRERDVQEKSQRTPKTCCAQPVCQRNEVVVLHPHRVIDFEQVVQLARQVVVRSVIGFAIGSIKLHRVHPIVK